MNKPWQMITILMSIFLLVAILTACAPVVTTTVTSPATTKGTTAATATPTTEKPYFNATGYPICDKPITLTVSGSQGSCKNWNGTVLIEQITKQLGINLVCSPIADDAWATQFALMLSSNKMPDILVKTNLSSSQVADYGKQGYFLALNDLIKKYAPNLLALMDKQDMLKNYMTSYDGNIYSTVSVRDFPTGYMSRVLLNKVWLTNVGLGIPKTIDDLHNVLKAFKEKDANGNGNPNDEIPLSTIIGNTGYGGHVEPALMTAFGIYTLNNTGIYNLQVNNGKVYLADTTDQYKAYLQFMNQLYKEKLLDAECFIQTKDNLHSKVAADLVGFFGGPAAFYMASKDVSYDGNFIWAGAFSSKWNENPAFVFPGSVLASPMLIANAKTKYPEALVRLIDYFYTEEGIIAGSYGMLGISCQRVDEYTASVDGKNKTFKWVRCDGMYNKADYTSVEEFRTQKAVIDTAFSFVNAVFLKKELFETLPYDSLFAYAKEKNDYLYANITYYGLRNPSLKKVSDFPALLYTEEQSKKRDPLFTDIKIYLQNKKAQFITGEIDINTNWDSYVATLNTMKVSDLLAIEQAAYNSLMKK